MASWNEEGYNGGGFLPSTSSSLEERKRQLLQWLSGRGATQAGYNGAGSAVGRMGGIGGRGPLPGMTYNPFFAQIAGRNENFPFLPGGISQAAASAVQQGGVQPGMGLTQAPGLDAAPGIVQNPGQGNGLPIQPQGGAAGRNLIGVGAPAAPQAQAIQQAITAPQPVNPYIPYTPPIDPFARNAAYGTRGTFRE